MPRLLPTAILACLATTSAFAQSGNEAKTREPAEQAAPNARNQTPAFANQTRAPRPTEAVKTAVETVAQGLPQLWAMEFLPDGRMLVTTKKGAMHIVMPDKGAGAAIANVPEVDARGQGGLLDVAVAPDFAQSGLIYFSFSEPRENGNGTSVARAKLVPDGNGSGALEDVTVIFRQTPTYDGNKHFGSRLAFAPDGALFVTVGERSDTPIRDQAQDVTSGLGKVFRINGDGSVPADNPFVGRSDAKGEIWSYGHRNLQSAAIDASGRLWTVEHGPKGGDELNRPEAGKNYGWPVITYGIDYSGKPIGKGITARDGMEQPVYFWDPVIGPSGMAFYEADAIPEWKGAILVGGLVSQGLVVLRIDGDTVAAEERVPLDARIRDVKAGPDGAVYAVTESRGGESTILRITKDGGA